MLQDPGKGEYKLIIMNSLARDSLRTFTKRTSSLLVVMERCGGVQNCLRRRQYSYWPRQQQLIADTCMRSSSSPCDRGLQASQTSQQHQQQQHRCLSSTSSLLPTNLLSEIESQSIDSTVAYKYLNLSSFTDRELDNSFRAIAQTSLHDDEKNDDSETREHSAADTSVITREHLQAYLKDRIRDLEERNEYVNRTIITDQGTSNISIDLSRQQFAQLEAKRCWEFLGGPTDTQNSTMTREEFSDSIKKIASSIDTKKVLPLTLSMILVGSSVGITTPVMPFVVQEIGLTTGEYGLVVSAFALSKMIGNIPSAVLVERHGRKPYLVYSMAAIAIGVGGIGLAGSFENLYLCRLATGLGVASLSTAVTMTVTDISTPLNRASSFAPVMSAFSAGTALGPAIGGVLGDYIGINPTFYAVGVSYLGLAAVNSMLLQETKPMQMTFPWQEPPKTTKPQASIGESFQTALGQWIPLLSKPPVRNVCIMNAFYWMGLAGSQMTLLPLILTNVDGMALTATNMGQVYMLMSSIQVLGNPVFAKVVDKVGKVPGIVGGCSILSGSMIALPLCSDPYQLAGVLGMWAVGSSLLSTSPVSYITDNVDDKSRAQAIALLRTFGDVGFLIGASGIGIYADWIGSLDVAMQSNSAVLLSATAWFAARNLLSYQLEQKNK